MFDSDFTPERFKNLPLSEIIKFPVPIKARVGTTISWSSIEATQDYDISHEKIPIPNSKIVCDIANSLDNMTYEERSTIKSLCYSTWLGSGGEKVRVDFYFLPFMVRYWLDIFGALGHSNDGLEDFKELQIYKQSDIWLNKVLTFKDEVQPSRLC